MEQLAAAMQGFLVLVARLSLAAIFIASAVGNKIPQFRATAEYMKTEGVPNPTFALFGAIGLLLLVFLCAATYFFHDFWQFVDPLQRQLQTIQFLKNVAIAGGLISLIAFGGGNWSVDGWISRRQAEVEAGAPAPKPRVTAKPTAQA